MNHQQPTPDEQRHAEVIAGIRQLAQFLEDNPNLPTPTSIYAQHTIPGGLDDTGRALIRQVAEHLGLRPHTLGAESYLLFDADSATARYQLAHGYSPELGSYSVTYIVHGSVDRRAGEQA